MAAVGGTVVVAGIISSYAIKALSHLHDIQRRVQGAGGFISEPSQ
jgi:hypothetical protein